MNGIKAGSDVLKVKLWRGVCGSEDWRGAMQGVDCCLVGDAKPLSYLGSIIYTMYKAPNYSILSHRPTTVNL